MTKIKKVVEIFTEITLTCLNVYIDKYEETTGTEFEINDDADVEKLMDFFHESIYDAKYVLDKMTQDRVQKEKSKFKIMNGGNYNS